MSDRIRDNQVKSINNIHQDEHQDSADAKRVLLVDENGNVINEANPLPTNATFTGNLEVNLDPQQDGVHLGDKLTGETAEIDATRRLRVHDAEATTAITAVLTALGSVSTEATLQDVLATIQDVLEQLNLNLEIRSLSAARDNVLIAGTENGQANGTLRYFVNNLKEQINSSHDRSRAFVWLDFGTKDERVSQINMTSSSFPGVTARKTFNYTQVGNRYRLDSDVWSIII